MSIQDPISRVETIFHEALDAPPPARQQLIARLCRGDARLRLEVESLLTAHVQSGEFLEGRALPAASLASEIASAPPHASCAIGRVCGRYRLTELLSSGGMGDVYRAEREGGDFEHAVAVKLIRDAVLTPQMKRRFHSERQVLARLEHPSITRLIDGGTDDAGRPYLVMELVEGEAIDAYCDRHRLSIDDRVRVFLRVCEAVQFAHRNLVVHRDLKPANVLVDESGSPKLLDFGIAKLLGADDALPAEATQTLQRALTPRYASPEQVRGLPITTATDVYSLGVILYELLTGHRPYELSNRSDWDRQRIICEQEPAPPSRAVCSLTGVASTTTSCAGAAGETGDVDTNRAGLELVASSRGERLDQLRRRMRGDLDNILMTALRKDPGERYASAEALADDLRRYLEGRPVHARPSTFAYRFTRLVQRNKVASAATAGLAVSLIVAVVGTSLGMIEARRARALADARRDAAVAAKLEAETVSGFLQQVLASASPYQNGRDVTLPELLASIADRIPEELADQPRAEADVRFALARTYANMWSWPAARAHAERARELYVREFGPEDVRVADCLSVIGRALTFANDPRAADAQREGLRIRRAHFGDTHQAVAESLGNLGYALWHRSDPRDLAGAEAHYLQSLRMYEQLGVHGGADVARFTFSYGVLLAFVGRHEESAAQFARATDLFESLDVPQDRYVVECLTRHALTMLRMDRLDEAEALLERARTRVGGTALLLGDRGLDWALGSLRFERGDDMGAFDMYRRGLVLRAKDLAMRLPDSADRFSRLALDAQSSTADTFPEVLVAFFEAFDSMRGTHTEGESAVWLEGPRRLAAAWCHSRGRADAVRRILAGVRDPRMGTELLSWWVQPRSRLACADYLAEQWDNASARITLAIDAHFFALEVGRGDEGTERMIRAARTAYERANEPLPPRLAALLD